MKDVLCRTEQPPASGSSSRQHKSWFQVHPEPSSVDSARVHRVSCHGHLSRSGALQQVLGSPDLPPLQLVLLCGGCLPAGCWHAPVDPFFFRTEAHGGLLSAAMTTQHLAMTTALGLASTALLSYRPTLDLVLPCCPISRATVGGNESCRWWTNFLLWCLLHLISRSDIWK